MKPISYENIPLFAHIPVHHLNGLLPCLNAFEKTYGKDDIIHLEQDKVQYIGIVLSGQVQMLKTDIWGQEFLMVYMEPGELFGESFAIRSDPTSYVSFRAAEKSNILFLSIEHIIHMCPKGCGFHQQLVENLFELLGRKNQQFMEKIHITSQSSLREKILAYLSLQAQKQNSRYIQIPLNRQDMAHYICSNRSAMTRELVRMKDEGLIDYDGNTFIIKKQ